MITSPFPPDEGRRLEALRALEILDTDPEEAFDRIAELAAHVFHVPIAQVSLVDEHREWFKASCGLREREGDRRAAFCAHTILEDRVLVVEDARNDARFWKNPQVMTSPGIRFYAGAPLRAPSGLRVGAMCIKDYQPRSFGAEETVLLEKLASLVNIEMEHRLIASELLKWKQVFEHADFGVAVGSRDEKSFELMNGAFARLYGYSMEELAHKRISDIFAPDMRHRVSDYIRKTSELGHHVFESNHIRKDGTVFPVRCNATAVKDAVGRVLYRVVNVEDITGRKRAEQALRESEALSRKRLAELELVYATAPIGLSLQDVDGRIIRINEHLAAIDGLSVVDHVGRTLSEILPQVGEVVDPFIRRVVDSGDAVLDVELTGSTLVRPSITALVSFHPLKSETGATEAVSIAVQDITERKRAEDALQQSHNLLNGVFENTSDVLFVKDADGRYLMMNSAGVRILDRPLNEILGRNDLELFPRELAERFQSDDRRVLAGSEVQEFAQIVPTSGEARIVMTKKCAWTDAKGKIVGVIGIARDVTEREWAEKELHRLRAENVYLREEMETGTDMSDIVGRSRVIHEVLKAVQQVAQTDSTVLVTGETGTGKEMIAKAVHSRSRRKDHILVKVNCAALPVGLIESELFGHEKGAFTGALSQKIGRFEMADRGTIFLDEVGDLPLELQAKLLRVLQEGEFERVGSAKTIKVDARVIAATNRDLEAEVAANRFRADLFYRLNVFPIRVPPLRERTEDIPPLASHFAMKHATKMGRRIESIPKATLDALTSYAWPGNVRELQNVIERAVILCRAGSLDIADWPPTKPQVGERLSILTLEEAERRHIMSILERTKWRVSGQNGAAEILGLKPTTLHSRMRKLRIQRPT